MTKSALVLAPFSQDALEDLGRSLRVSYESWTDTRLLYSPEELSRRINEESIGYLVIEADFVFDQVFQDASPLELLGVCRNSLDHVDVAAATQHGVAVVHTPGRNAQAVAELTLGLMLSLARGIPRLNSYVREGRWENPVEPYMTMRGVELNGNTLGIIGLGAIGRKVARLARAFGMKVVAFDPYAGDLGRNVAGAMMASLDEVLMTSDFVSVHTPDTSEVEGMLSRQRLGTMKGGSYIINTAAHSVIDEEALLDHLKFGHIAGAAVDVHRTHPVLSSSPLLGLDNVIFTPHIGGATEATVERQSRMMVEDIRRFLQGQRPRHLAKAQVWRDLWRRRG